MSASSVVMGEDAAFFNAVAPICLLTWFASSIVIALGSQLQRGALIARPVAA